MSAPNCEHAEARDLPDRLMWAGPVGACKCCGFPFPLPGSSFGSETGADGTRAEWGRSHPTDLCDACGGAAVSWSRELSVVPSAASRIAKRGPLP